MLIKLEKFHAQLTGAQVASSENEELFVPAPTKTSSRRVELLALSIKTSGD
jgi:hypothetical protein